MALTSTVLSEVDPLTHVLLKHPREAFVDERTIAAQWRDLRFSAPPDLAQAIDEADRLVELLQTAGAEVHFLPRDDRTTLDSIYVRDASIAVPAGMALCHMGKSQRAAEPAAQERTLRELGVPLAGAFDPPARLEGGDLAWLDARTVVVGCGYRTGAEGIARLRALVGPEVEVIEVPLPHWRGQGDVMHLMSLLSPVDHDLAVVYSPLLPVPFRERLRARVTLVEVPDEEFESMGTNVLALGPRRCLMLAGNPATRRALEAAGCEVLTYDGREISVKGAGGPTCLTRPLARERDRRIARDGLMR
jgi:N-dimethylarginine dimethylaminohydrolase